MAPSRKTTASRKKRRTRSHFKKQRKQEASSVTSAKERDDMAYDEAVCSTPKGEKFRIAEVSTCPPAPKKPRVLSNYSLRRSLPLSFFAPPELEIFLCIALRDLPVSFAC